jgi:LysM repeat protein
MSSGAGSTTMPRRALKSPLYGLVLALALLVLGSSFALAQEEEGAEPSTGATAASQPETARPAPRIPALVIPPGHVARAAKDIDTTGAPEGAQQVAQAPAGNTAAAPTVRKYFPYTVREGDTLGKVARSFGVPLDELARLNHLQADGELFVDDVLKIPNPFKAETTALGAEVTRLSAAAVESNRKLEAAQAKTVSLTGQNAELLAENSTLKGGAAALPWWRGTALGMMAVGLMMLGITLLTLFEWWTLRRRFVALSDLTQSLSRLDVKYKEMLAKAELRMQQLYGRRRGAGSESGEHAGKTSDEIEIERLDHELRQALERHLERLGVRTRSSGRRSRWGETIGGGESPIEARSARR